MQISDRVVLQFPEICHGEEHSPDAKEDQSGQGAHGSAQLSTLLAEDGQPICQVSGAAGSCQRLYFVSPFTDHGLMQISDRVVLQFPEICHGEEHSIDEPGSSKSSAQAVTGDVAEARTSQDEPPAPSICVSSCDVLASATSPVTAWALDLLLPGSSMDHLAHQLSGRCREAKGPKRGAFQTLGKGQTCMQLLRRSALVSMQPYRAAPLVPLIVSDADCLRTSSDEADRHADRRCLFDAERPRGPSAERSKPWGKGKLACSCFDVLLWCWRFVLRCSCFRYVSCDGLGT
jgi:hypothetical protein